jgi:hypothetical protein
MTKEQKISKILSAAASHGWADGIYRNEIDELRAAGRIKYEVAGLGGHQIKWFLVGA